MKHRGNTCSFHEEREDAVLAVYQRLRGYLPCKTLYKAISESPSPRFWISEERAAIVYGMLRDGKSMGRVLPRRRAMYTEICNRMTDVLKNGHARNSYEAACIVVMQESPSFYMSPSAIGGILKNALLRRSHGKHR